MAQEDPPAGMRWYRLETLPDEGRVLAAVVDGAVWR